MNLLLCVHARRKRKCIYAKSSSLLQTASISLSCYCSPYHLCKVVPPQLGTHQPSSPLWVLLARAQESMQRRAPQLNTALHQPLTIFITWFCLSFFLGEIFVFLIKKTQTSKTPTMTKPDINGILLGTGQRPKRFSSANLQ